jgi:hypothetical protein
VPYEPSLHIRTGEFFGLGGIKSSDRGNFFPYQEIRSRPLLAFALTTNAIVPTDPSLPKRRRGRRQMLEAAEADLALKAGFVHVKARQAFPEIGRQVT